MCSAGIQTLSSCSQSRRALHKVRHNYKFNACWNGCWRACCRKMCFICSPKESGAAENVPEQDPCCTTVRKCTVDFQMILLTDGACCRKGQITDQMLFGRQKQKKQ